ncbi:uncharacterized protein METZ01_LOCUS73247 [marine metagenome]|uniref:Uncharacterized protein n=1 Tax=marine metagenome TaxID=408172 RepID=A0A381U1R4_9ZZZZ
MKKWLTTRLLLLGVMGVLFVLLNMSALFGDSPPSSSFGSHATITVQNGSTTTDYDGVLPITMQPQNLILGGFVNSSMSDTLFTDQNATEIGGIGQNITQNAQPFFWYGIIPKQNSKQFKLYTFNDTPATHKFPLGGGSDHITIPHSSSLNITDDLTLEASVNLKDNANKTLMEKPNAWKIFTDANGELQLGVFATFDGWGMQNLIPWPTSKTLAGDGDYDYSASPNRKILRNESQACQGKSWDGERNYYTWSQNPYTLFDHWSVSYDDTHDYPSALGGYNSRAVAIFGGYKDQHSDPANSAWQNTSGYFNYIMYPYVNSIVNDVGVNWFSDHEIGFMFATPRGNTPATWALAGIPYNDSGIFTAGSLQAYNSGSYNQATIQRGERLDDLQAGETLYNVAGYKHSYGQSDTIYNNMRYDHTSNNKMDGGSYGNGYIYDDDSGQGWEIWKIGTAEVGLDEINGIRDIAGLTPNEEGFWFLNHGNGVGTTNDMLGDYNNDGQISSADAHIHFMGYTDNSYIKMNTWTGTYWPCKVTLSLTPFDDTTSHTKRQPDWSGDPLSNVVIKAVHCNVAQYYYGYIQGKLGYDANHSDTTSQYNHYNGNDCISTSAWYSGSHAQFHKSSGSHTGGNYPNSSVGSWYLPDQKSECFAYEVTNTLSCGNGGSNEWAVEDVQHLTAVISTNTTSGSYPTYTTAFWVSVYYTYDGSNTTFFDTNHILNEDTEYDLKVTLDYPELKVYVDDVEVLTDNTSLSSAMGTSTDAVVIGNSLKGWVDNLKIGGVDITSPTYVMDLQFEPSHNLNTQVGDVSNSWNYTGSVADQSASANNATYSITADTTDITTTMGGLVVADEPPPSGTDASIKDQIGAMPIGVFLTPQPVQASVLTAGLHDASTVGTMPQDAWWLLLATIIATVAGAKLMNYIPSLTIVAVAGGVVFAFIILFAGLTLWFLAFYTLWALGTISIQQYWKA